MRGQLPKGFWPANPRIGNWNHRPRETNPPNERSYRTKRPASLWKSEAASRGWREGYYPGSNKSLKKNTIGRGKREGEGAKGKSHSQLGAGHVGGKSRVQGRGRIASVEGPMAQGS